MKENRNTVKHQRNPYFTQISNALLESTEISLKAKGLYSYMFSKPENWNFTIKSMAKQLKEGTTSISNALIELKDNGWVEYTKYADGTGEYFLLIEPKEEDITAPTKEQQPEQKEKPKTRKKDKFTLSRVTAFENLSKQYQDDLKEYIAQSGKAEIMSYEDFRDGCMMKGYKYKNFKLAYDKWAKNAKPKSTSSPQPQTSTSSSEEEKIKAYYLSNGATEKQLQGLSAGLSLLKNSPHKRECIYSYIEELKLETYAFSFLRYAKECGLEREAITKTVSIMGQATYSINGVQDDKEHRYNMTVAKEFEKPYMYTYAPRTRKGSK